MKKYILYFSLVFIVACEPNEHGQNALTIKNNSSERIYSWYSGNYSQHHFPDTILPISIPVYIGSISAGNISLASGVDPNWNNIFSQLPEGKFSVYFFETYPETQEDWDELRNNMEELVERKDVTYEELKANDYVIEYP